jgi:two-component system, LuxR family, sensor kinase FixL
VLAILAAFAWTIASLVVYRAINQDPDASVRHGSLRYILPVAAAANLILLFVIARLAAGSATDLQDSNERLRSVIDSAVDGIIVIDDRARIEAFNRGAERLFGYPASDVIGQNVNVLMPAPYHEEHDGYLARYLATGSAHIIGIGREVSGRRRDGTIFPLHLSVGEMTVGGARKFTGVVHDLSARVNLEKQLRSSEARWRTIIESAVDGIVVIDARGRVEAFNPAAERLFGYSEAEVHGRNVNVLMPSPYHEEHDQYLARYQATHVKKIIGIGREVTGRRKDGSTFPVHLSVAEMVLDGETKFTGILHDLTERTRIEAQLREQTALARLGEMAAVIAHEVKNPLAGIRGAIQIIGGRLPKDSKDAQITQEIISRIDALNALMKDLLLFARPPQPKPLAVELKTLVTTTADLLNADPALKGLRVEVEGSAPPVLADPDLLKIVFVNLLVNGAHAMNGQGIVRVAIGTHGSLSEVTFSDSGPGIPADVRARIFTPFFTTKSRGSGLGLPTAKRLVEAHHGTIDVECPPAGGTTVTVRLPTA